MFASWCSFFANEAALGEKLRLAVTLLMGPARIDDSDIGKAGDDGKEE